MCKSLTHMAGKYLNIDFQNINIFPEFSKDKSYLVGSTIERTISSFALTSIRFR